MTRREAVPLIEREIASENWLKYLTPQLRRVYNVPHRILDLFQDAVPNAMDRPLAVASAVERYVEASPVELVNVPQHDTALVGQIEILLEGPVKIGLCVVYHKGEFWVLDREFFPFPGA